MTSNSNSFTTSSAAAPRKQTARKPDFFIIGAPKAGTTSLYAYLASHPRIFMPRIKEPSYFSFDMPKPREHGAFIDDIDKYLKLFAKATDYHLACGEASTSYLPSKVAVPNILQFNPAARFIVMLRNPVDRVHSFHSHLVRSMCESVTNIEKAWQLQEERARGRHVPRQCIDPTLLQYRQVGRQGVYVERLLSHISRDRVALLLLEDFSPNPNQACEKVLAFLGVPKDHRAEFPQENPNRNTRSRLLAQLVRNPPFPLNVIRHQYRLKVGVSTWPARALHRVNSKQVSRQPLSSEFRRELEAEFHDDVRLLERLIDRDLSHWISRK